LDGLAAVPDHRLNLRLENVWVHLSRAGQEEAAWCKSIAHMLSFLPERHLVIIHP
jgi:hypothetical protein